MDAVELRENQISLYYWLGEDAEGDVSDRKIPSLMEGYAAPLRDGEVLGRLMKEEAIWRQIGQTENSDDANLMYPQSVDLSHPVRELISGRRPDRLSRYKLNPDLQHALRYGDLPSRFEAGLSKAVLCLEFGQRAKERITRSGVDALPLWIDLEDVELISFGTGARFITVNATLRRLAPKDRDTTKALSLVEFREAVHALSRFNDCGWYDRATQQRIGAETFSLGQMIQSLGDRQPAKSVAVTRVPSYSYAFLDQAFDPSTLEREAAVLARRYTSDYKFTHEHAGLEFLRDFEDVRHAITTEGVATLQCARASGEQTDFSKNWKNNALKSAYLPVFLLLLHENWFLTDRDRAARQGRTDADLLDDLESVVDDAVSFGLFYRFPSVSQISMHQRMSDAIRKAFDLDVKFAELQRTARQVAERLRASQAARAANAAAEEAEAAARRASAFGAVASFGTAALSGLTAYTILKDVVLLFTRSFGGLPAQSIRDRFFPNATGAPDVLVADWFALLLSVIIAVLAFFVARKMTPRNNPKVRAARVVSLSRIAKHLPRKD